MRSPTQIVRDILLDLPARDAPWLIGLSGPQGAGKSTLASDLTRFFGPSLATLSLDDFYLTRQERLGLANAISPLFETRGPPGTHDTALLERTLHDLACDDSAFPVRAPSFDKRADDRAADEAGRLFDQRPRVILVEGWCVGAIAPPDFHTAEPMNVIEDADTGGEWRRYQADQLRGPYARLWDRLDRFIHLQAPSFEIVFQWRAEQESTLLGLARADLPEERVIWVRTFIAHYERLTIAMSAGWRRPGVVLHLDEARRVTRLSEPSTD